MATETGDSATQQSDETGFGHISRLKGRVFHVVLVGASFFGIVILAVLLAFVFNDAFQLTQGRIRWYLIYIIIFIVPSASFVAYSALRNRSAGSVAARILGVAVGTTFLGAAFIIFFIIIETYVWFAYFLLAVLPAVLLVQYTSRSPEVNWGLLEIAGVFVVGTVLATLLLDQISSITRALDRLAILYISLLLPVGSLIRLWYEKREDKQMGNIVVAGMLIAGLIGIPVVEPYGIGGDIWLILLLTPITPTAIAVGQAVRKWESGREGLIGVAVIVGGLLLATAVANTLGIGAPDMWLDCSS